MQGRQSDDTLVTQHHLLSLRERDRTAILTRPPHEDDPTPAIVFVHGSGPGNEHALRDEASILASAGIAFLAVEKVMDDYSSRHRDYTALASDTAEAVRWLSMQPGIDPDRIGVLGISEGGWVSTLAASHYDDLIAFVILVSAAVITPGAQMLYHMRSDVRHQGKVVRMLNDVRARLIIALCDYRNIDIRPALRGLRQPVLDIWGEEDPTIPIEAARDLLVATLPTTPKTRILAGQGHFPDQTSGWLDDVIAWVATV